MPAPVELCPVINTKAPSLPGETLQQEVKCLSPLGPVFSPSARRVLGSCSSVWETLGDSGEQHPAGAWSRCDPAPTALVLQRLPLI